MLSHIADHLQVLALLALQLSMSRLSINQEETFDSPRTTISGGVPEKRSALEDELDLPGKNVLKEIIEGSIPPETEHVRISNQWYRK
jgi:hypothetical protein